MNKLIAVMMVLVMVLTFPASSLAAEITDTPDVKVKMNSEYAFTYTEYTDTDNSIIRTYSKQENPSASTFARGASYAVESATSTEDRTKAVLTSLGMSPAFADELSEQDLEEYANSSQITSVVSYTKTDVEGNVVNVPEEEALSAASVDPDPSVDIIEDGGGYPSHYTSASDAYMKLLFVVSELGGGRYKYSVDAEWLTMPIYRLQDCVGIAVQNSSVSYGTYSGWYQYTTAVNHLTDTYSYVTKENFTDANFAQPGNNIWDGGAATFWLPTDQHETYSSVIHSGFKVHFECEATVTNPQLVTVFNATATYDHTLVLPEVDFSVDIAAVDDKVGCVFGLGINSETRIAYFDEPFTYEPE